MKVSLRLDVDGALPNAPYSMHGSRRRALSRQVPIATTGEVEISETP